MHIGIIIKMKENEIPTKRNSPMGRRMNQKSHPEGAIVQEEVKMKTKHEKRHGRTRPRSRHTVELKMEYFFCKIIEVKNQSFDFSA